MKTLHCATAGLAFLAVASAASWASAAEVSPVPQISQALSAESGVQKVQGGRCVRWRNICRARWGVGWRFRRCMTIHGCL